MVICGAENMQKNEEGVSGVVGLTKKGASLLAEMSKVIHLEASSTEIVCESQMKSCAIRPLSYRYVMSESPHK